MYLTAIASTRVFFSTFLLAYGNQVIASCSLVWAGSGMWYRWCIASYPLSLSYTFLLSWSLLCCPSLGSLTQSVTVVGSIVAAFGQVVLNVFGDPYWIKDLTSPHWYVSDMLLIITRKNLSLPELLYLITWKRASLKCDLHIFGNWFWRLNYSTAHW